MRAAAIGLVLLAGCDTPPRGAASAGAALVAAPELDLVAGTLRAEDSPVAASDGADFLVVFHDDAGARARRVLADGGGSAASALGLDTLGGAPRVAFGADRFLTVWKNPLGVRGRFLFTDGGIDSQALSVSASIPAAGSLPAVAFDGARFVVVWTVPTGTLGGGDLEGATVELDSGISAAQHLTIYATRIPVADLSCEARTCLLTFTLLPFGQAMCMTIDTSGAAPAPVTAGVSCLPNNPGISSASAARAGPVALIAGGVQPAAPPVYLSLALYLLADAGVVPLAQLPVGSDGGESRPAVLFDGTNWVLAWQENEGVPHIATGRISARGAPLDGTGVALTAQATTPAVALSSTQALLAYVVPPGDVKFQLSPLGTAPPDAGGAMDAGLPPDGGVVMMDGGVVTPDGGGAREDGGLQADGGGSATPRALAVGCSSAPGACMLLALGGLLRRRAKDSEELR